MLNPKIIPFDDIPSELENEALNIIQQVLTSTEPQEHPFLIHLCGVPGSGKSTYAAKLSENLALKGQSFAILQFDVVMEALPGYQTDKRIDLQAAFAKWEIPARIIGYHLMQALLDNRRSFVFDHSAAFPAHVNLLSLAKNCLGYRVEMHRMLCSTETAVSRVKNREKQSCRYTPERLIYERVGVIENLLPQYQAIVDRFIAIENS